MAGKSLREALQAFVTPTRQAVSLVVPEGRGVLTLNPGFNRRGQEQWITFAGGRPVQLVGNVLLLNLYQRVLVARSEAGQGTYEISLIESSYRILDRQDRELLAYHYHPAGVSWCKYPHLHIAATGDVFSGKAHLATGRDSLPAVIRMLIEDRAFPVVSLRPDLPRVLDDAQAQSDS